MSGATSLLGFASPGLLVVLGVVGVAGGGLSSPGTALLVLGVALFAGVAWEMPWRTVIDVEGVDRRSVVRRRRTAWDDVVAFERGGRRGRGSLVLRVAGGHRTALCDVAERPDQWDALRQLIADNAPGVALAPPPPGHPFRHRDE